MEKQNSNQKKIRWCGIEKVERKEEMMANIKHKERGGKKKREKTEKKGEEGKPRHTEKKKT